MGILDIFKGDKPSGQELTAVLKALEQLSNHKTPITVFVESTNTRFNSTLALKGDVIMVAKPPGLADQLHMGSHLRVVIPHSHQELRLEVSQPHLNLKAGSSAIVCRIPNHFDAENREDHRINTARFNNIHLHLHKLNTQFAVVDLSTTGVKIKLPHQNRMSLFPIGQSLGRSSLMASKFHFDMDDVIPRVHVGLTVGCEFIVPEQTPAHYQLEGLLRLLAKNEQMKMTAE